MLLFDSHGCGEGGELGLCCRVFPGGRSAQAKKKSKRQSDRGCLVEVRSEAGLADSSTWKNPSRFFHNAVQSSLFLPVEYFWFCWMRDVVVRAKIRIDKHHVQGYGGAEMWLAGQG
jgi:hypothetical protein